MPSLCPSSSPVPAAYRGLTRPPSLPCAVAYMQAGAWRRDPTTKLAYRSAGAAANEDELAMQDMRHSVQGLAQKREGGVKGRSAMQQGMAQLRQNLVAAARGADTREMVDQELSKAERKAADDAKKARMERLTRSTNYKTLAQRREEEEEERKRAEAEEGGVERDDEAFARESRCVRARGIRGSSCVVMCMGAHAHAAAVPSGASGSTTWRPSSWRAWRSPTRSSTRVGRTCGAWATTRTGTGRCGNWATKRCPTPRPCASARWLGCWIGPEGVVAVANLAREGRVATQIGTAARTQCPSGQRRGRPPGGCRARGRPAQPQPRQGTLHWSRTCRLRHHSVPVPRDATRRREVLT